MRVILDVGCEAVVNTTGVAAVSCQKSYLPVISVGEAGMVVSLYGSIPIPGHRIGTFSN
jgi:hypothetical protein